MQWEALFQQQILRRALNYYQTGHVKKFNRNRHRLTAVVQGVRDYQVTIVEHAGGVSAMTCTCSYASSDRHCKHMAAVLYFADHTVSVGHKFGGKSSENYQAELFEGFADADTGEWRSKFIQNLQTFTVSQCEMLAGKDMLAIDPSPLFTPLSDLPMLFKACEWLVSKRLPRMVTTDQQQMSFDILTYIYLKLCYTGFDQTKLIDECGRLLSQLLTHSDGHIRRQAFRWLFVYSLALPIKYSWQFENVLFYSDTFSNPYFLNQKLALIDHKIDNLKASHHEMRFQIETTTIEWTYYRVRVMKKLKLTPSAAQGFCIHHRDDPVVSDYFIDNCREQNDLRRAVEYCHAGIQVAAARDDYVIMNYTYSQLVSLYQACGTVAEYRQILLEAVTKCDAVNSNWYVQLRQQYLPADWPDVRRKISAGLPRQSDFEWDDTKNVFVKPYILALQQEVKTALTPESQLFLTEKLRCLQEYQGSTGVQVAYWLWQNWYRRYPERKVLMDAIDEWIVQKIEK